MQQVTSRRKPIELHIHDPKHHMGGEEKEARADAELTMGNLNFSLPPELKSNQVAIRKWREVTKIYKEAGLTVVSSTDNGVIGRYCILYSEFVELVERRAQISNLEFPEEDEAEILALTMEEFNEARAKRLWRIMEYFTGLDGLLKIDKFINAKSKSILDIEDRIFMNPAAKVRTLPIQRKAREKDPMGELGFDV